jgi:hypothetical protein
MSDTAAGLKGKTDHVLLPLSKHAGDTLLHLARLAADSCMQVSPFCYEHPAAGSEVNEIRGWCLDTPAEANASSLPVGCAMFDGISIVRCEMTENEILEVLRDAAEFRRRLGEAVQRIRHMTEQNPTMRATWARCQPAPTGVPCSMFDACRNRTGSVVYTPTPSSTPILDCDSWQPELSDNGFVGVFHQWVHGAQDHRLCLYVACRSYLPAACLEYADVVHDMDSRCDAATVLLSEETHWLRRANVRNRSRIIAEVCSDLGLKIQTTQDHNAHTPKDVQVAVPIIETMTNDIYETDDKNIRVVNAVAETSRASNGVACILAPWEGVVIFRGAGDGQGAGEFGSPYGRQFIPTLIPRMSSTYTNEIGSTFAFTSGDPTFARPLQVWGEVGSNVAMYTEPVLPIDIVEAYETEAHLSMDPLVISIYKKLVAKGSTGNVVLLPNVQGLAASGLQQTYLRFDEAVLCAMAKNKWDRSRGYTVLVPLATALASMCPSCEET